MPIEIKPEAIYTTAEAAEETGISKKTVERACKAGEIRAAKVARMWRITGQALLDWLTGGESSR